MSGDGLADWARDTLGHAFADLNLLRRALTHSSAAGPSYQRLEFLGDRVLGCVVAAWLYRDHDEPEGRLTARYHGLVEGPACAEVARALGVPDHLVMEKTIRARGLGHGDNVLGDVAEAIVAAVFLDGGFAAAEAFVHRHWGRLLDAGPRLLADPKSRLQEWALERSRHAPMYELVSRDGPDHAPRFRVRAVVRGQEPAEGEGPNKREAEKAAAVAMLARVCPTGPV
ncbi:MAG: ribonuclease III [Sphingomonadaceae bacterium]|nr:ribonuclease III [Sphingomonadaceae bacterium]